MNGSYDLEAALSTFRQLAMFEDCEVSGPESPGMDGDTPLHIAAMDGDLKVVELFIPFVKKHRHQRRYWFFASSLCCQMRPS
ncbi:ankyrin repeat domain-containing protein [Xanthomonas sacchari]|uniref:ankyrin repeat domain-containing protein n=1 Tax=Xanthomonas sacchari TaxID=56458 RepID=UPI00299F6BB9|nr:ankyrin repeat domain-containing protein [Xanthomonas sacchari]